MATTAQKASEQRGAARKFTMPTCSDDYLPLQFKGQRDEEQQEEAKREYRTINRI